MDEGKPINQKKYSFLPCVFLLISLGIIAYSLFLEFGKEVLIVVWPIMVVFSIILIFCFRPKKHQTMFYEHGIAKFEKGKMIGVEPYDDFIFIECYRKKYDSEDGKTTYYCLAFWREDATYVEVKVRTSMKELKKDWENILLNYPNLRDRLGCLLVDKESQKLFELLKNDSY